MQSKKIHFYSAYLKRGGACIACDSLFNSFLDNFDEFKISRSCFYENGEIVLKNEIIRLLGKVISLPTCQNQFYIPYSRKNHRNENYINSLVHAHWINSKQLRGLIFQIL